MELRPKFSLQSFKKANISALREFTDREEPTKAFIHAFERKEKSTNKVLTYYGVGGIGKSRLLRELYQKTNQIDSTAVKAIIDFKEEKHRIPGEALIWLREELKKNYNIKFSTFDLAYTIYWKKLNPQLSMKTNGNDLPFIEEGSFIGELVHQLENVPLAQWVPKTLKLINGMGKYKEIIQWWTGRGKDVMMQLQDMLPNQIEEMLSVFWAADLRDYIKDKNLSAVIFIDTYEALWENKRQQGSFYERDSWARELVLQLPEVLWVICGREKIQWGKVNNAWNNEKYLEQHLIGELSKTDCHKFLQSCGILNEEVRHTIIEASHGLPYYLDLMVDTYNLITENSTPQPNDFSSTPQEILDRFLRYLELSEKETLKILSFARFWDIKLFQAIVEKFNTGFPLTAYLDLFRFSFINETRPEQWVMHAMMRTSLQDNIQLNDKSLFQQVHVFLFKYYDDKLLKNKGESITEDDKWMFQEAFYHGRYTFSNDQFLIWFLEKGKVLKGAGQFQLISSYYEEVVLGMLQEKKTEQSAAVYQFFGEIFLLQGKYEEAANSFAEAISIFQTYMQVNRSVSKDLCKCSIDLAEVMVHTTNYEKAFAYLTKGIMYSESNQENRDHEYYTIVALLYIRLGKLNIRFSNYDDSLNNYKSAIAACDEGLKISNDDSKLYAKKALAFEKLGELYGRGQYDLEGECYRKSIYYYQRSLENIDVHEYLRILTNKGLVHKRLGEHYSVKTNPSDKIKSFKQAIHIYDEVLEQSPYFIDALEKKGHATVDYMVLQIELDLLDEAMVSFQEAVATFHKVIDYSPKQGGSRNRLASAYREVSQVYLKRNQWTEALEILQESLKLSEEVLKETPNYVYVNNSIGKTYELIADIYLEKKDLVKAVLFYQTAVKYYDKMLQIAPKLREPLRRKEGIKKKLRN
ncbi:tetratricopeptide repeat protein [Fictibacillus sp. NPDC058756]|uniref:tetratricopeptide repeat protein n=1 Tax=Fictibacillus sp. NPDC058756 TaxID=3346625 RepID=UPI0036B8AAF3